jgi:hypothetical protein
MLKINSFKNSVGFNSISNLKIPMKEFIILEKDNHICKAYKPLKYIFFSKNLILI